MHMHKNKGSKQERRSFKEQKNGPEQKTANEHSAENVGKSILLEQQCKKICKRPLQLAGKQAMKKIER